MKNWRRIAALFLCSVAVCVVATESRGFVINVPGDAQTIQGGIDLAMAGDTVLVAPGIYDGLGNRDLTFDGTNLVLLSMAGASMTTIDCQGLGRGITFSNGEDSTSVVDGFAIERGKASVPGALILVNNGSSPVIRNCELRLTGGSAGVIRVGGGSPAFQFCEVLDDTAAASSGILVFVGGSVRLHGCMIHNNVAASTVKSAVPTVISLTKITDNTGIGARFDSTSCVVSGSEISRNGGRGVVLNESSATFTGVVFRQNGGGGVVVTGLSPVVAAAPSDGAYAPAAAASITDEFSNCEFSGHSADRGAGFFFDCTNEPDGTYSLTFINCQFTGNYATFEGGGIAICGHATNADIIPWFVNCTIAANSANEGGGVYMGVSEVGIGRVARADLSQTILWGNCSTSSPDGEAYVLAANEIDIECSHTDVDEIGGAGTVFTSQVTTGIPYFCDYPEQYYPSVCAPDATIDGDFDLSPESPAAPDNHPCGPDQIGAFPVLECVPTGIAGGPEPELTAVLRPPAPNPFNPVTTIEYTLPADSRVTLRIYDVGGRLTRTLVDRPMPQGVHQIQWNGRDDRGNPAVSGVYFLRFDDGRTKQTQKMVLLK